MCLTNPTKKKTTGTVVIDLVWSTKCTATSIIAKDILKLYLLKKATHTPMHKKKRVLIAPA